MRSPLERAERVSIARGTVARVAGTPIIALSGLLATAVTVRATGESAYGLVALVATTGLFFPFADLGIGSVVTTAVAQGGAHAADVVRRGFAVLGVVAGGIVLIAGTMSVFDVWTPVLGGTVGPGGRWILGAAVCLFGLSVPLSLGTRIVLGLDRNDVVVAMGVVSSLIATSVAAALYAGGVRGVWFVLPPLTGLLCGNALASAVGLRWSGIGVRDLVRPNPTTHGRLLTGSAWLLVTGLAVPFGLQVQRLILSHRASPQQLSAYSLYAQLYAITWAVFSTAALALWPMFVRRRTDIRGTLVLWRWATLWFTAASAGAAVILWLLGPVAASVLSGGIIDAEPRLAGAFAILLVAQCMHVTSGMLLTTPAEARWQSACILAMGTVTIVGGVAVAPSLGAVGVVLATVVGVVVAQVVPDLAHVPRLIASRRPAGAPA
ncbi:oligosaccharide flippase family protein [Rhodococcus sp. BP-349]|uniref:lipopolysaccharide biosynthesis protein n=1 Tax=unclassified Rhodococcus (in: high G+C Gram-positive bacteria) TaxID=192944 RepID=UPI001C9B0971|nr:MULTISPECIES: hypothetical protein [unclassified Rhodococcus (in: high G+C Gram-positive bacteria)]MBY6539480.1 oligosaccharide flippase family protein [Rhodococcus sp. BP-363]MBY6544192.1 oligosaccharide flippase family protein [Rhodococcus sp. BP-369]MBY6563422.1 oligosaccharide flippase family protein [Rhodococcus sp. BP-370]MBY6577714.1 oligosaccharide flippase family protein [Rhodococcus sp. BP-364]MBY6587015.1 oligosaccharide flippase family protein [Rhodococcus sp. BP-358]